MSYSKEEKAMRLEKWHQSGKSAHSYARENGLVPWTFSRCAKEEKESGFVEVEANGFPKAEQPSGILIEKGDIKIHIPLEFGHEGLTMILERLRWAQ
jgi:hypothetical protein